MPRGVLAGCMLAAAALLQGCTPEGPAPLPGLGAKLDETTVSGISSGAYMAGQFQLAHASLVKGAAIIAGGPYGCAESVFAGMMPGPGAAFLNSAKAVSGCMQNAMMIWGVPSPDALAGKARRLAEDGRIDPIDAVTTDQVYLFTGSEDRTVVPPIVRSAYEFYVKLGVPPERIRLVEDMPAGHAFVTEDEGGSCDVSGKPYIVDCDYDQAGALLSHVYGRLEPRSEAPRGRLVTFDQRPYTAHLGDHGLSEDGFVYVPASCAAGSGCRVHIAFHGCAQNRGAVGDAFARETGFQRWADTNRLIVLFPQTLASAINPQACWDWWGYTGRDYLTREAPQIVAVRRMLARLGEARPPS
jgi:hypothetical protein